MDAKPLLVLALLVSSSAYAQYGTTYIGTERKSGSMYKWTDNNGKVIYSDSLPPASCKTPSCEELLKVHQQKQVERFPVPRQRTETNEERLERIQAVAKEQRKKTHLLAGTIVCTSARNIEMLKVGDYRVQQVLINRRECFKLTFDVEYAVAGRELGFCKCLEVILTGLVGTPSAWVESHVISFDMIKR